MNEQDVLHTYPMGPNVRAWLKIPEAESTLDPSVNPSTDEIGAFQSSFLSRMSEHGCRSPEELVNVLEELVGMNLPLLAIAWVDANPAHWPSQDFRAYLHLGNACMLAGELARAVDAFQFAQSLIPEEPAPYVNLANVLLHMQDHANARIWCEAGLSVEPNNFNLWKLRYQIAEEEEDPDTLTTIRNLALKLSSWAGTLLAFELKGDPSEQPDSKLRELESFKAANLADPHFLIEYTAAMGQAGRYDMIPATIWAAENRGSKGLSWQLFLHGAQAEMGMGRTDLARQYLEKAKNYKDLPENARQILAELDAELSGHSH